VKQFIEIMKTLINLKILIFSCLCMTTCYRGHSQESLLRVLAVEKLAESPAMCCFSSSFAGFHFRNDFGMKEMMFAELSAVWFQNKNALLATVNHYGYANYGDMQLTVGYGRNFGDRFAMTARIFYLMAHARGYPVRHSLSTDFSMACKVSPKLYFDATVYNPFMMRYGVVGQEVIPMRFSVGCSYLPVPKLLMALSVAKTLPGAWEVDCRFLTQPIPPLLLAASCSNTRLGVFIGLIYRKFLISVAAEWHYRISVSPQIGGVCYWEDKRMGG
jgi:hypothetical protein